MINVRSKVQPVTKWRSPLGGSLCPYDNRFAVARWYFYRRYAVALEMAGRRPAGRVLDVGCWEGHFLPSLAANYDQVFGIDNDAGSCLEFMRNRWTVLQSSRELCRLECVPDDKVHLVKAEGESLPFASNTFDIVFCMDSLPFTPASHRPALAREIRRVLKSNGTAIFSLPVEIGPAVLIREAIRSVTGSWRDGYTLRQLIDAVCFAPRLVSGSDKTRNLIGYDYRIDCRELASVFNVKRKRFFPWKGFRWISPTVLLHCAPPLD